LEKHKNKRRSFIALDCRHVSTQSPGTFIHLSELCSSLVKFFFNTVHPVVIYQYIIIQVRQ